MIRDRNKSEKYFENFIDNKTKIITTFQKNLDKGKVNENQISAINKAIFENKLYLLIGYYSLGKDKQFLKKNFEKFIYDTDKNWNPNSGYIKILWIISLANLLLKSEDYISYFDKLITKYNYNDWLLDFLLHKNKFNTFTFIMNQPYSQYKEIVNSENTIYNLKTFLSNNWYHSHKDMAWYNSHLDKKFIYYGYWSFESAAIIKILNLNNTQFIDIKYFPSDLI